MATGGKATDLSASGSGLSAPTGTTPNTKTSGAGIGNDGKPTATQLDRYMTDARVHIQAIKQLQEQAVAALKLPILPSTQDRLQRILADIDDCYAKAMNAMIIVNR